LIAPFKMLHHSSGDWDFEAGADWDLDNGQFVSAPSSLRIKHTTFKYTLVKTGVVPIANVKEGQMDTYVRVAIAGADHKVRFVFRYQDANNYYCVEISTSNYLIIRRKAGVETTLDSGVHGVSIVGAWGRFRVTWWNDYVGIVLRFEKYVAGAWIFVDDGYDSENNWQAIGGRCGFIAKRDSFANNWLWIDDTNIYGVV